MSSKYHILPNRLTDCVTDWDRRKKRDELTAAFLEAFEEEMRMRGDREYTAVAIAAAQAVTDGKWHALQAHIKEAGQ